jgi:hypothetical protein
VLLSNNTDIIQCALQDANKFSLEQGCQNLNHYYQNLLGISKERKDLTSLSRM